jgi:cobalt-zinc-cadmium efflux system membrane fusion protein
MALDRKSALLGAAIAAGILILGFAIYLAVMSIGASRNEGPQPAAHPVASGYKGNGGNNKNGAHSAGDPLAAISVELSPTEYAKFKVGPALQRDFLIQRDTVGTIDFNEDMSVQVFTPFQGKIISLFAKAGDDVKKGAPLFTIDSPDLVQAESTLVAAAGTLELTGRALKRATELYAVQGVAQRDLDQATSDQQAAEGAFRAARDALRIFGKSDAEMDRIVAGRKIDSVLAVGSPISGRVTARNAAPGLFVQPGNAPAPYIVTDLSTVWMLANVAEVDIPLLRIGQSVEVSVKALPDHVYHAEIAIAASVDPNTHCILVRANMHDPEHNLRPGMFATFLIRTGKTMHSPAVPDSGVVREGDGTMTVWVAMDQKRIVKRAVKVGLQQDGYWQIVDGLEAAEPVVNEGALFLSNALTEASR